MFSRFGSTYSPLRFFLSILLILTLGSLIAQPYGNEWINYNQRYYKFPVFEEGVYRINYNTLANAGIPLASIDPRTIQVYNREQQVPIYVRGEEDGVFGLNDFIELYATGNDGWLDALVYDEPENQINPFYSLYNDTIYYYLTWEEGNINNQRFEPIEDQNLDNLSPMPFVWKSSLASFTTNYFQGELDLWGTSTSYYTAGEGWFGPRIGYPSPPTQFEVQVNSANAYTGVGAPLAKFRAVAASNSSASVTEGAHNHHLRIHYGNTNNPVYDETFFGYQVVQHDFTVNSSQLGGTTSNVIFQVVNDLPVATDYIAVSHVLLDYPMVPNFSGSDEVRFSFPSNGSGGTDLLEFTGIANQPIVFVMGSQPQRIVAQSENAAWRAGVPMSDFDPVPTYVVSQSSIKTVTQITPVGAAGNGFFTNYETFNVDSAYVIVTHQSLMSAAQEYAQHRSLRFNTFVVGVSELYDQFGGGFDKSGLAIRRFMDFLYGNWDTPPQYLFLLGKSVREAPDNNLQGSRKFPDYYARNLVPSFGYPSSDNLITVGLQGNPGIEPMVRTGRLAAETIQDVEEYLDKVITYENQPPAEWMKNIMHFGGGANEGEQNAFKGYLENYAGIISDTCFGGIVHPFYKESSEPVSINLSSDITELIEGGVSLMTFFGHAGGTGFDQSIDNPLNFDWNGKYPFLIGNACYTGDIHSPAASSTSEDFLLLDQAGVIGFLSTVKLGFATTLNQYSSELYKNIAYKNYGGTVGDHIRKTIQFLQPGPSNLLMINQVLGMTLHGDPGIVLNSFAKPDYAINESSVYFEPAEVTTIQDSLTIHIDITNIGKATNDSFDVIIERKFPEPPNGADSVYVVHVNQLFNRDTISLTIPVQPDRALGQNFFSVSVDLPVNAVDELDNFGNNVVQNKQLLITNGGIIPVYPYKYAVIGQPEVTLKASTGDPFASNTNYVCQIDTSRHFNSPFLNEMNVTQGGGLVEFPVSFTLTDSTVYFWRVAINEGNPGELKWRESSFQYIPEKTGWGQAHFHQFHENYYAQLEYNEPERLFDFFSGTVNFRCRVEGGTTNTSNEVTLNLDIVEYAGCGGTPAMHVVVLNPNTFEAWGTAADGQNPQNNFGNANNGVACRTRVENYFIFRQNNAAQMQGFSNMVLNAVPDDHYLLIYTWRYLVQDWLNNTDFYGTMNELGASIDPTGQDSIPYIFFVQKGDLSSVQEMFGTQTNSVLEFNVDLEASGNQGAKESVIAGPVGEWGSFHYRFMPREVPSSDSVNVRLHGVQWNNSITPLDFTTSLDFSFDQPDLSSWVDASQYPFLRMRAYLKDDVDQTPAQLKRWHLLYDEIPEAVVNPNEWFIFESPEAEQGQEMLVSYAITNASTVDMDSLLVRYWVINAQNSIQEIDLHRIAPLPAGESIIDSISFDTWGLGGINQFWLEVNPTNPATGQYDQLEQYHFNNFLQISFEVNQDIINPLLDVTFDGLHILDGEIVSAEPEINIALTDENLFLMLNEDADTSNFEIFFSEPGGEFERHYFYNGSTQNMIWVPASGSTNRFQILYRPKFHKDGIHTMLVRGTDKSGNSSGDNDYRISFEVINQSTITDVLNYPNPFSTKTHFVFTLTGSQVPDYMKIQIMTITGKIVREITHMELGPIRVGRNLTDYYWDGTDMYGDRLANGIYLYRVIAKINGETISKRETSAGKYFKQEFGKMYLMR